MKLEAFESLIQLPPNQQQAVLALAAGRSNVDAARAAGGVTAATLARWARRSDFQEVLRELKTTALEDYGRRLDDLRSGALAGMGESIASARVDLGDEDPTVRAESRMQLLQIFGKLFPPEAIRSEPVTPAMGSQVAIYLPANGRD